MRRALVTVLTVVVALGGTVALIAFFQSRDAANVSDGAESSTTTPGTAAAEETDPRLAKGDVILTYRSEQDGAVLKALADDIAGPPDEAVVDAGQAIIVLHRPHQSAGAVVAHAKGRKLVAPNGADPRLRQFAEYWLGRAAN